MSNYELIGAVGVPVEELGWLVPLFRDEQGNCFPIGDSPASGFPCSSLEEYEKQGAILRFKPLAFGELPFSADVAERDYDFTKRLGSMAYVFYCPSDLAKKVQIEKLIGERVQKLVPESKFFHDKNAYFFLPTEELRSTVLPRLFGLFKEEFRTYLAEKFEEESLCRQADDVSDRLCHLMGITVHDIRSAEEAVIYQGLSILLGPHCSSYRVWLRITLDEWRLSGNVEYWKDRSYGILDETERGMTLKAAMRRWMNKAMPKPVLQTRKRYSEIRNVPPNVEEVTPWLDFKDSSSPNCAVYPTIKPESKN